MEKVKNNCTQVLLVGNPNTGKTSLVNRATKSALHIGNWHGVTVGATARALAIEGYVHTLVDLPGTYSLSSFSLEEKVTADFVAVKDAPILNICEQNNLRRNLLLTLQLLELGLPVTLLVNKFSKSTKTDVLFDVNLLSEELGINVEVIDFFSSKQIKDFFKNYNPNTYKSKEKVFNYLNKFPITKIKDIIKKNKMLNMEYFQSIFSDGDNFFIDKIKCKNDVAQNIYFQDNLIQQNKKLYDKILTFAVFRLLEGDNKYIVNASNNAELSNLFKSSDYQALLYKERYKYIDFLLNKCNYKIKNNYLDNNKILEKNNNINIDNFNKCDNNITLYNGEFAHLKSSKNTFFNNNDNKIINNKEKIKNDKLKTKKIKLENNKRNKSVTQILDKILLNKYLAIPIFACLMLLVFYLTFLSVGAFFSEIFEFIIVEIIGAPILSLIEINLGKGFVYSLVADGIIGGVGSVVSFLPQVMLLFLFLTIFEESGYMARLAYLMEGIFCKVGLSGKSIFTFLMGFGCTATAVMTAENLNNKNEKIKTILATPFMSCSAKLPVFAVIGGAFFAQGNVFLIFLMYICSALLGIAIVNILDKTKLKNNDSSFILEFPPYRIPTARVLISSLGRNTSQFLTRIGGYILFFSIAIWLLQSFTLKLEYIGTAREDSTFQSSQSSILQCLAQVLSPIFAPLGFGEWGAVSTLLAGIIAKELIVSSIGIINNVSATNELVGASLMSSTSAICFTPASALSFLTFCLLYTPCIASISVMRAEIGAKWTAVSVLIQLIVAYICSFFVYKVARIVLAYGWGWGSIMLVAVGLICYAVFKCINYMFQSKKCSQCSLNKYKK